MCEDDLPGSGTLFFGPRWDAPRVDHATQVDTPAGQWCVDCKEPIEPGDRGLMMGVITWSTALRSSRFARCTWSVICGRR
jgi:hypothetical protein